MDNLFITRSWVNGISITEATLAGSIRQSEKADSFFAALYLLLETEMIESAHLALVDVAHRCAKLTVRSAELSFVIVALAANVRMGHLYFERGVSEQALADAVRSIVDSKKSGAQGDLHQELLLELCALSGLAEYAAKAFDHVIQNIHQYGAALTESSDSRVSLLKYDPLFGLYTHKLYHTEIELARWLHKRLGAPLFSAEEALSQALCEVLVEKPMKRSNTPIRFHSRQMAAIALCSQRKFSILSGGPGTGKTSTVVALLRVLLRLSPQLYARDIALVAPTGRAAARMEESVKSSVGLIESAIEGSRDFELTHIHAQTIHRFLKYNPGKNGYTYTKNNQHPAQILIVDEVSMVDAELFLHMAQALSDECIVILLGDHNQLPSVQAGAVLSDLVGHTLPLQSPTLSHATIAMLQRVLPQSPEHDDSLKSELAELTLQQEHILKDAMIVLTKSHRSEAEILALSHHINLKEADAALNLLKRGSISAPLQWPLVYVQSSGENRCNEHGVLLLSDDSAGDSQKKDFNILLESWAQFHFVAPTFVDVPHTGIRRRYSYGALIAQIQLLLGMSGATKPELLDHINSSVPLTQLFNELFAYMNQAQILCITKNGAMGVHAENAHLFEYVRKQLGAPLKNGVYSGLPIIITQNNYMHSVFNGDCGVVLEFSGKHYIAMPGSEGVQLHAVTDIASFEAAYAITVHKSQGSEYEYALIILPKDMNRVMTKEILYTAITRAKYFAGIVASPESFKLCIQNSISRKSAIARRIMV